MAAEPVQRIAGGPGAPGMADIRQMIAAALLAVPAVFDRYLASGCDGMSPAAASLGRVLEVIRHLDETVQGAVVSEALLEASCARAVEEDRAAWPRPRGYPLRAV